MKERITVSALDGLDSRSEHELYPLFGKIVLEYL